MLVIRCPVGRGVLGGGAALVMAACSNTTQPPPPPSPPPQVAQVTVSPPTASLTAGTTLQLQATARDSGGTAIPGVAITWSSENTGVATVSPTGLVSAVGAGQTSIVAQTGNILGAGELTVSAPGNATITLQPSTTYQTMLGWEATSQIGQHEFNANVSGSGANFKDVQAEVLNRTVNELGINRVRLEFRAGYENDADYYTQWQQGLITRQAWRNTWFNPVNDNNDPNVRNDSGFQFSELDGDIVEVVNPMRALLAANGESLYVNLTFTDFGGLQHFQFTNVDEYAELVLAVFQHIQSTFGWVPDAVEMILEPDNGTPYTGTRIGQGIVATQARLQAAGYSPDFVAPSTTSMLNAPGYFDEIITVPGALAALTEISYHRYSQSLSSLQQIAARATANNLRTAHLEHIGSGYQDLLEDITTGMNSSWAQFTIAWYTSDGTDDGGKYYLIDDSNPSSLTVSMGSRTPFLRQYMHYIRRGAVRIGTSTQSGSLEPVAFINANGRYVVVVSASSAQGFTIGGLPGGTYGVSYTTNSQANIDQADVAVAGGSLLSATIPAAGVITIYGK